MYILPHAHCLLSILPILLPLSLTSGPTFLLQRALSVQKCLLYPLPTYWPFSDVSLHSAVNCLTKAYYTGCRTENGVEECCLRG